MRVWSFRYRCSNYRVSGVSFRYPGVEFPVPMFELSGVTVGYPMFKSIVLIIGVEFPISDV